MRPALRLLPLAPILVAAVGATPSLAGDPAPGSFVGQRVFLRPGAKLDTPAPRHPTPDQPFLTYRVEKANGPRLWLVAQDGADQGWADSQQVVRLDQAIDQFTREIKSHPTALAFLLRGKVWANQTDEDKAIADFTEAIRLDPNLKRAFLDRATGWARKSQYARAIADFSKAIRLDPKDADSYVRRGVVHSLNREPDAAIADYTEAIRLDPKNARAYESRGQAWSSKDQFDRAIADLTEAIRLNPQSAGAYGSRGEAWSSKG